MALCSFSFLFSSSVLATIATAVSPPSSSSSSALASRLARLRPLPLVPETADLAFSPTTLVSSSALPFALRPRFFFVLETPETRLVVSTLGERE
jgi:hypothetical protein